MEINKKRGQFLTKRSEKVDFFGILLSGRAFLTIEAKVYGYIDEGDFIGYMNYLKLKGYPLIITTLILFFQN